MRQIKSRDFSIIASNCSGTLPYRFLDMPYTSPTIDLYFMAPDYIRFVKQLDYYLAQPLTFISQSRYQQAELVRQNSGNYPVGVLDDIEIHFMHYDNEADATAKWNRRKNRINKDKLIFAFTDRDLCTPALLKEFDSLPFENKFVFTANPHPDIQNSIQIKDFAGQSEMGDAYTNYDTLLHVNFARLIDGQGTSTRKDTAIKTERLTRPRNSLEADTHIDADNARASSSI